MLDIIGFLMGALWPVLLLLALAALTVRVVHQQTVAIVETFGRYSRTLTPGLNFIVPVMQTIVSRVDLRVREIKAKVDIKTNDNAFVEMPVAIMARVIEDRADDSYYKLDDPTGQIKSWVLATLRSATSGMALQDLFSDRSKLETAVKSDLEVRMKSYGYEIVSVLIDQPTVGAEMQRASNRVLESRREREAAEFEAEANKIRVVGEATAEAESQKLRAQGLSEARTILANGLTALVVDAKAKGVDESGVMQLLLETNRLETIKHASEHGKLVLMDTRSTPPLTIG